MSSFQVQIYQTSCREYRLHEHVTTTVSHWCNERNTFCYMEVACIAFILGSILMFFFRCMINDAYLRITWNFTLTYLYNFEH